MEGKNFGEIIIDHNRLESFSLLLNDVNVVGDDIAQYRLVFSPKPRKEGIATIVFEDGSEFEDVKYKIFISGTTIQMNAILKIAVLNSKLKSSPRRLVTK